MSFTLVRCEKNDFTQGRILHYTHEKTGCEVIHAHNDDKENAFVFSVPTHPQNSTGVAHILEHTVLCGSEKYQTKTPFYHLFEGSCKTYLNALTYPDCTLYPGASTIKEDLFNLFDVYADAIWFPLLRESFFRQEGFHFSNTDAINAHGKHAEATPPNTSGVVFNEMKGAYSDRDELLSDAIYRSLFPHSMYRFDSGGDPKDIPLLSYEEFVAFHKQWYRPEYTKILLYGNIPSEEYLDFLETKYLARWNEAQSPAYTRISMHKPLLTTQEIRVVVPHLPHEEEKHSVDLAWVLPFAVTSTQQRMTMVFLHSILMAIPGSPLRKVLLDSELAEDISNISGYEGSLYQAVYDIGLTGVAKQNVQKVAPLIDTELARIVGQGFDDELIAAAMHRTEFYRKESLVNTTRKIRWLTSLARIWLYDGDVLREAEPLRSIEQFKEKFCNSRYLTRFAQEILLNNTHKVVAVSQPEKEYDSKTQSEGEKRIRALWNSQDAQAKKYWQTIEEQVAEQGNTPDSAHLINAIPRLNIHDLPRSVEVWDEQCVLEQLLPHGVQWLTHSDNDIVYMWLHFDVTDIVQENNQQAHVLPILASTFTDLGTASCPYDKFAVRIRKISGVFQASINSIATVGGEVKVFLSVAVHAMSAYIEDAIKLIRELCMSVAYDNTQRLEQILHEEVHAIKARMTYQGTHFAMIKAASRYSNLACIDDTHNALEALDILSKYTKNSAMKTSLSAVLSLLARRVYVKNRLHCTVVSSLKHKQIVGDALKILLCDLLESVDYRAVSYQNTRSNDAHHGIMRKAFCMPSQVSYNACVLPSVRYSDESYASHAMVGNIASSMLWESIRMKYGAYGAGCGVDGAERLMQFYTYRDPNIEKSFQLFFDSLQRIAGGSCTQDQLEKLRIGMIGESLKPASPSWKGIVAYERMIAGVSNELRQHTRDCMFALTREKVKVAAQECVSKEQHASFASLCSTEAAKSEKWHWDTMKEISS